ncbi:MAG: hypothetical protein R2710_08990 [Acidimicrobiales bacterium]
MPWGVEDLSCTGAIRRVHQCRCRSDRQYRFRLLRQAVADGLISLERLDAAARQVLVVKFELGLFDDPIVDVAAVDAAIRRPHDAAAAATAERQALVMLTGDRQPLIGRSDVVLAEGELADALARRDIEVTDDATPPVRSSRFGRRGGCCTQGFFGSRQLRVHPISIPPTPTSRDSTGWRTNPTTAAVVHLDRPVVQLSDRAAAVFGEFGVSADALADVLTMVSRPPLGSCLPAPSVDGGRGERLAVRSARSRMRTRSSGYGHGGGGAPSA